MVTTTVQLSEAQLHRIEQLAVESGQTREEVLRRIVDEHFARRSATAVSERYAQSWHAIGKFSSGQSDVAVDHDQFVWTEKDWSTE